MFQSEKQPGATRQTCSKQESVFQSEKQPGAARQTRSKEESMFQSEKQPGATRQTCLKQEPVLQIEKQASESEEPVLQIEKQPGVTSLKQESVLQSKRTSHCSGKGVKVRSSDNLPSTFSNKVSC